MKWRPEKTQESNIALAYAHTDSTSILVTDDRRSRDSLPPTCSTILLSERLSLASRFKRASTSPALAPGMHLTMGRGFTIFTFLTMELPTTRECFSAGVSLSREHRLETCRLVVRSGLLFRLIIPSNSDPAFWLGNSQQKLRDVATVCLSLSSNM